MAIPEEYVKQRGTIDWLQISARSLVKKWPHVTKV
jgi:hypothetical protein